MFMRRLLETVKDIKQAINKQTRTAHEQQERQEKQEKPKQEIRAEIRFNEQTVRDSEAKQKRNYSVQNSIRWAAWAAFIAASVYAGIAALQAIATQGQLDLAHEVYESTRRPYIGIEEIKIEPFGTDPRGSDQDLKLGAHFKNYGASPAEDVTLEIDLWVNNIKKPRPYSPEIHGIIFPGQIRGIAIEVHGTEEIKKIQSGEITLVIEASATYQWGNKTYPYCEKWQYASFANEFTTMGNCSPQ
jgi:hypothetical protein